MLTPLVADSTQQVIDALEHTKALSVQELFAEEALSAIRGPNLQREPFQVWLSTCRAELLQLPTSNAT